MDWQFDTPVVTCASCSLFFTPRSQSVVATVGSTFYMLNAASGNTAFASVSSPVTNSIISYVGSNTSLFVVDAVTAKQLTSIQLDGVVQAAQVATQTAA